MLKAYRKLNLKADSFLFLLLLCVVQLVKLPFYYGRSPLLSNQADQLQSLGALLFDGHLKSLYGHPMSYTDPVVFNFGPLSPLLFGVSLFGLNPDQVHIWFSLLVIASLIPFHIELLHHNRFYAFVLPALMVIAPIHNWFLSILWVAVLIFPISVLYITSFLHHARIQRAYSLLLLLSMQGLLMHIHPTGIIYAPLTLYALFKSAGTYIQERKNKTLRKAPSALIRYSVIALFVFTYLPYLIAEFHYKWKNTKGIFTTNLMGYDKEEGINSGMRVVNNLFEWALIPVDIRHLNFSRIADVTVVVSILFAAGSLFYFLFNRFIDGKVQKSRNSESVSVGPAAPQEIGMKALSLWMVASAMATHFFLFYKTGRFYNEHHALMIFPLYVYVWSYFINIIFIFSKKIMHALNYSYPMQSKGSTLALTFILLFILPASVLWSDSKTEVSEWNFKAQKKALANICASRSDFNTKETLHFQPLHNTYQTVLVYVSRWVPSCKFDKESDQLLIPIFASKENPHPPFVAVDKKCFALQRVEPPGIGVYQKTSRSCK